MDQYTQYLMCVKTKDFIINSYHHSTTSWEEQAFAEDARGPLGGFVWPPRSYSCSFCKREFKSAQALGGHMNVHRRERARLKQSHPSPPSPDHAPQSSALLESTSAMLSPSRSFVVASSPSLSPYRVSPVLGHANSFFGGHDHNDDDQNDVETNFFVDGLNLNLSGSCVNRVDVAEEMEDIDLELRLGDSPKMK